MTRNGRAVRLAAQTAERRRLIERGVAAPKQLLTQFDVDAVGNPVFQWQHGDLSNPNDNLYTGYEYARNEAGWIVDRVSRMYQTDGGPDGTFVSGTHHYYDGVPFVGLPLGTIGSRGTLHRTEAFVSPDTVPPLTDRSLLVGDPRAPGSSVNVLRRQADSYGNTIASRDANGNRRIFAYDDALHKFCTSETIVVGGGAPNLQISATYDHRHGVLLTLTDMSGQLTRFTYDDFGRMIEEYLPGDPPDSPTRTFSYDLGAPVSAITTTAHDTISEMPDMSVTTLFDGQGRTLGTYDAGGGVMTEVTRYNTRGWPWKAYQPYFGGDGTWSLPPDTVPALTQKHDATGRVIETISPPDADGLHARSTTEYFPLVEQQFDGEDNNTGGPHADTPKTLVYDGLGRLVAVHEVETRSLIDTGVFVTTYRYALPDHIAEIEDANSNVKYMRYDGLGRRIFTNDLDGGHTTFAFDAVGNLVSRVDALGQETTYTYDGANRILSEDFLDAGHPLSENRTPDVAYHYDQPHPDHPQLANATGRLSWIDDLTGAEIHGYDARGHLTTVVKRIDQPGGSTIDYTTQSPANNRGQVYRLVYPDGDELTFAYDARGLLRSIPGFITQMSYTASGQRDTCTLANTAVTSYTYDPRQRLRHLSTQSAAGLLQDLSYGYDQVANITAIEDHRPLTTTDPRNQSTDVVVDNLYRLTHATGPGWGAIAYDFDRLGNMAVKTSQDIVDPDVHVGTMTSGGLSGTENRIGRGPGDPPGPHAVTATDNGQVQRSFGYDANGNLTSTDMATYVYDFANRLGRVTGSGDDIRYLYDYAGRRVIKRINGVQTSYVNSGFEVRGDAHIKYVTAGGTRVARVDGSMPRLRAGAAQAIDLVAGWNLVSFQVDPGTTDPTAVLASIDGLYTVVFGHDGSDYTQFVPDGVDNTLTELHPNRAYWILMTAPGQWHIEGAVSQAGVPVLANTPVMVALPGLSSESIQTLRQRYPHIRVVWAYGAAEGDWFGFAADEPAHVNTLATVQAGLGYWIISDAPIVITLPVSGDVAFYHQDHLGSTNVVTDANGAVVSEFYVYPFGSSRYEYHAAEPYEPYYRFIGKEHDQETGLHYFEARYHDSSVGRFRTVDPAASARIRSCVSIEAQLVCLCRESATSVDRPDRS